MARSTATEPKTRVLALGNDILSDDGFAFRVAEELRAAVGEDADIVTCSEGGFALIEHLLGADRAVIVDTIITGRTRPGTVSIFPEGQLRAQPGCSLHMAGLLDVLATARALDLRVPRIVTIVAVEAADCTTLGGGMDSRVTASIPVATRLVGRMLAEAQTCLPRTQHG
jgi:hydrogenase maturation protease